MDNFVYMRGFSDTDISGAVLIVAALVVILSCEKKKEFLRSRFVLSSILLGFASGIKVYFGLVAFVLFIYQFMNYIWIWLDFSEISHPLSIEAQI